MTREDILSLMKDLSYAHGKWGYILNSIRESKRMMDNFFAVYNPAKYNDCHDFLMDIEG